jgi:quinol monooxygenase YgiN
MLIVAGILKIDPSKRAVLEAAFDKVREATLKEQGCLAYQAYLDRSDPGTLLLFEKWESEAALNAHFVTPHMAEFGKALGGADIISADVKRYDVSGETKLM